MKKKLVGLGISIMVTIGLIGVLMITGHTKTFKKDGIMYALNVVDITGNVTHPTNFPAKGSYKVDVECINAKGKWLYDEWKLNIEDPKNDISCKLTFTSIDKTTIANKIISLNNTTQGNGKVVNEPSTDYRYEGKNPNNYVWFNNELWRIIGVFGNNTHGQSGNLVKIMKADSLDGLPWDAMDSNVWASSSTTPTSSLNVYLNNYYYSNTDPSAITLATPTYKFPSKEKGIKDTYRGMIQQVTWKLGGHNNTNITSSEMYDKERGTTVPNGASTTYTGYIGLMYPSDYGYSVLASSCSRTTTLINYYRSSICSGQSWIYGQGSEWTITPDSSNSSYAFYIHSSGEVSYHFGVSNGYATRPVLYLKSSVYVVDGNGSITNPYILMNV